MEQEVQVAETLFVSNPSGGPTPEESTLPSVGDSSEHPPQDSSAVPPQTDHPETTGHTTESLVSTENRTVSILQQKETRHEFPDVDLSDTVVALVSPKQEISAQVPFDLDTISTSMYPSVQQVGEDKPEELKEKIRSEKVEREAPKKDEMEVDKNEGSVQLLQKPEWPPTSKTISSTNQDEDLTLDTKTPECSPLEEPGMRMVTCDGSFRSGPSRKEAGLRADSIQAGSEKVPGIAVTSSLPAVFIPEASVHHKPGPEQEEAAVILSTDASVSGGPTLTCVCKSDVVLQQDKDREPCSTEEAEVLHDDPAHCQTGEGLESQLPLPNKNSEAPSAQPEVMLSKTLIPSIAFFCAAICLAAGFQEPSVFLVMGLFLISLCF